MAAPTTPTNLEIVAKSVEYALKQINNVNGFRTNGILVAVGVDPTNFTVDQKNTYDSLNRYVGVYPGVETPNPARTGGVRRKVHSYPILCEARITLAERQAGRNLTLMQYDLMDDLYRVLDGASNNPIEAAAVALGYPARLNDGKRMSCINHKVADVQGVITIFPQVRFSLICEFEYDRPV